MENLIWFFLFLPLQLTLFFMMVKFGDGSVLYLLYRTQEIDELMKETFLDFLEFQSCTYGFTLYLLNIQIPLNILSESYNYKILFRCFNIEAKMETDCHNRKNLLLDGSRML